MANIVYMAKSAWTGLLDAIRSKASVSGTMTVSEATTAVENIPSGVVLKTATATTGTKVTAPLEFANLEKEPDFFAFYANADYTLTASNLNAYIMGGVYNGVSCVRIGFQYNSSSSVQGKAGTTYLINATYDNGTLTLSSPSSTTIGFFPKNMTFTLYYV